MFSTAGALGLGYKDGSGVPGAEARDVGTFDRITTYGKQRVEVTVGGPTSVRVEGDDNLVDDVEVTNEDGGLVIYHYGDLDPKLELVVRVTVPTLSAIEADGLTEIRVDGLTRTASRSAPAAGPT